MISSGHARPAVLEPQELRTDSSGPPPEAGSRRPRLLELGVGLVVVAVPLVFLPMSATPFVDVKIAVLLVACLLIWAGSARSDRTVALLAGGWVGALGLSAVFGVDRWLGLTGQDNVPGGLILLGPCAFLLVSGAALPRSIVDRVPTWLFVSAVPVAVVAILSRFAPEVLAHAVHLDLGGSTLGYAVLVSGMMAVALAGAAGVRTRHRAAFVAAMIVLASALSLSSKRAGLVAVAVGLVVTLVRARPGRARTLLISGVVVATVAGWTLVSPLLSDAQPLSGVGRFQELTTDSAQARVAIAGALLRASRERPVLGWGVGNTWTAYLSSATPQDVRSAHRDMADAHDIVIDSAVTTGLVGFGLFASLLVLVVRRAWRNGRSVGWAAGAASALFVFHLLQPLSASLTPLLFLLAGIAAGSGRAAPGHAGVPRGAGRTAVGVLLSAGLAVSMLLLASSVLHQWGRTYNSTWSLRGAVALAPGRIWPVQTLAVYRAQDAAAGEAEAGREARDLVNAAVGRHPLNPDVRMIGVDVGLSMNDPPYARDWLQRQVDAFPSDLASLPPPALEFLRTGILPGRDVWVQRSQPDAEATDG